MNEAVAMSLSELPKVSNPFQHTRKAVASYGKSIGNSNVQRRKTDAIYVDKAEADDSRTRLVSDARME